MSRPVPYRPDGARVLFVDYATGKGVLDTGAALPTTYAPSRRGSRRFLSTTAMVETARAAGVRRVYLTGPRPVDGWLEDTPEGWRPDPAGHYHHADAPTARWLGPTEADRVEVRRAAEWLGDGSYSPAQAREALAMVRSLLRAMTKGAVELMASPAATGQSLWAWSLPRPREGQRPASELEAWEGAQLDDEAATLTRRTSTQHRMEAVGSCYDGCTDHLAAPEGKLAELHYLDGRFMYLACVRARAAAPGRWLSGPESRAYLTGRPHGRARLLGSYRVPPEWDGPGLLMEPHPDGAHWHAPNRPGYLGSVWADSLEWWQAVECGWPVEILGGYELCGPAVLEPWARRVLQLREQVNAADADEATKDRAKGAVRMMALATIGSFHSTGRDRTILADGPAAIPDGVTEWTGRPDGSVIYRQPTRLAGNAARMLHPELSAQVWAMARWRVTSHMLTVPRASLVAVWGDALYLDHLPTWALPKGQGGLDDGAPGRLRPKGHLAGPVARPRDMAGVARLRTRMVADAS